jgi:hypothetical protein
MKRCPKCQINRNWSSADCPICATWLEDLDIPSLTDNAPEAVNHPDHYNASPIECIDAIEAALTPEEFRGFIKGNVLKYVWREKHKAGDQDLAKAAWYVNRLKK